MAPPPLVSASAGKSLYTSILAPPPAKRARTIHNPEDPPIVAPPKPKTATTARKGGKQASATAATSSKRKSRKDDKGKGKETSGRSSGHRLTPRSSFGEDTNNDVDMKAAATLTSLLLSRPALSASSPRSSLSAGSDAGSLHSSHFAQSSARTTTASAAGMPSHEQAYHAPYARSSTPPPLSKRTQSLTQPSDVRYHSHSRSVPNARVTPKTQSQPIIGSSRARETHSPHNPPTDSEAADLMLFLATSPSPVRPTTVKEREAKDAAAYRTLSGNPALQGRVLFPGSGSSAGGAEGQSHLYAHHSRGKPLQRDGSGFSSTLSIATDASGETVYAGGSTQRSIGISIGAAPSLGAGSPLKHGGGSSTGGVAGAHSQHNNLDVPQMPTITPPTPTDQAPQGAVLPLAPSQSPTRPSSRISNPDGARVGASGASSQLVTHSHPTSNASSSSSSPTPVPQYAAYPVSASGSMSSIPTAPPTPSNVPFNLHDFLNVSPSPAASTPHKGGSGGSLRADVGRRLFEEHHASMGGMGHVGSPGRSHHAHSHSQGGNGSGLGAGIDLVNT